MTILSLCLPFIDVKRVVYLWKFRIITNNELIHFMCEHFGMCYGKHFIITQENELKTDNEATWDRIHNTESMKNIVLNNLLLNNRLKTRLYTSLTKNKDTLLKYYYEYHNILKYGKCFKIELDTVKRLFAMSPFKLDGHHASLDESKTMLVIRNNDNHKIMALIHCCGTIETTLDVSSYSFILNNPDFIYHVYNKKRKSCHQNEHRRPKIRRG